MKLSIALFTSAVLLSAPAVQANDQLARSLGVEAGEYTTPELIRLKAAYDEDDAARKHVIKAGGANARLSTRGSGQSGGHRQLAESMGVDPNAFSTAQLIQLRQANDDQQHRRSAFVPSGSGTQVAGVSTRNVSTSGSHRQMAASLGVDPAVYSTAELIEMRTDRWSD